MFHGFENGRKAEKDMLMSLESCEILILDHAKGIIAEIYRLKTADFYEHYCRFWINGKDGSPLVYTGNEKPTKAQVHKAFEVFNHN